MSVEHKTKSGRKNRVILDRIAAILSLRHSIGVRFITFAVLVAILAGGIVGFTLVYTSRDSIRQSVLQNNLDQANLAAEFSSNYMKVIQANVLAFSTRSEIVQAVLDDKFEDAQTELAQFAKTQSVIAVLGIYDNKGILRVSSEIGASTIGTSYTDRDYFQQVSSTLQPYQGIAVKSRTTGVLVAPYGVPIMDSQELLQGILVAGISLEKLSDAIVNPINLRSDTRASIMDARSGGLIIAHSDPKRILTAVSGKNEAAIRVLRGERGAVETISSSGETDLIGFAPVPDLPWGVMVITPSSSALALINTSTWSALFYIAIIVFLVIIIGVVLMRKVTGPLYRLVEETKAIGQGNLEYKVIIEGKDEISDLSRAFGEMTLKLKNTLVSRDKLTDQVNERIKAEESLRTLGLRYKAILAAVPDIIMEVDQNKVYTWANDAGLKFFGKDVIDKTADYYFEGQQETYQIVQPLFAGSDEVIHVESWQRRIDGEKRLLGWWCRVIKDETGNVKGVLSSAQDITELKRAEESIKEKNLELERFTYSVSHDLKSPLVTIKTFLGYLIKDITASNAKRIDEDLGYINNASHKMGIMLDELLEMSRIGRITNSPANVTFTELVQEALNLLAGHIKERRIKVKFVDRSLVLFGDRTRLVEIWQNLIENAIKFMGDQPSPSIKIGFEKKGKEILFFVRDNGIGIEPAYQSKVFNLFEKLDNKTEGTGLGLALVEKNS